MKIPNSAVGGLILMGWIGSLALAFSLYPKLMKPVDTPPSTGLDQKQLEAAVFALEEFKYLMKENDSLYDAVIEARELETENKVLRKIIDKNVGRNVVIRYQTNGKTRVYDRENNVWVTQ